MAPRGPFAFKALLAGSDVMMLIEASLTVSAGLPAALRFESPQAVAETMGQTDGMNGVIKNMNE